MNCMPVAFLIFFLHPETQFLFQRNIDLFFYLQISRGVNETRPGTSEEGSCPLTFIIKLYALLEEPAVLNNCPLPGATSLGKNAAHVRNSCQKMRCEWEATGCTASLLQLGMITPFPTRRLLFSLPPWLFSNPSWHLSTLEHTLLHCGSLAVQPLPGRKVC